MEKLNLKDLEIIKERIFKKQCDLDIQKALVNVAIKKKQKEKL
ncbi:hypothetical protein [Tenacibaculum phage JQ]|nr:hypothetical protein [Tenacibaculum phage JQ]